MMVTPAVGSRVRLIKGNECAGIATLIDGDTLHGYTFPRTFQKVILEAVKPGVPPELKGPFEDDCLCNGQITAWPFNQMECM